MSQVQSVSFVQEPATIEINGGVAIIRQPDFERAMSLKTLARFIDRGQRALKRHANGDENIIVDD